MASVGHRPALGGGDHQVIRRQVAGAPVTADLDAGVVAHGRQPLEDRDDRLPGKSAAPEGD